VSILPLLDSAENLNHTQPDCCQNLIIMKAPKALTIVAWLFIIEGAAAVVAMIISFYRGSGTVDLTVLDMLIGFGLLRLDPTWYRWAVFSTWVGIVLTLVLFPVLVFASSAPSMTVFSIPVGTTSRAYLFVIGVIGLGLFVWQLRVLRRRDVSELFPNPYERTHT
jgi:hypothetical protein